MYIYIYIYRPSVPSCPSRQSEALNRGSYNILRNILRSNSMKNGHPNVTTNPLKLTHWAPFGEIVEIGSGFWKTLIFFVVYNIFDRSNNRKNCKKSENEAKAGPREANVHCRIPAARPQEGLLGLEGGTSWQQQGGAFRHSGLLGTYFFRYQFSHRYLIIFWRHFDSQKLKKSLQK